tara:strand:+ start:148 stop:1026 length:879 start_codon:yes stop_codon:yes gene_type:complete
MNTETIKYNLENNGYCIIENVLNPNEIFQAKELFYDWYDSINNFDFIHSKINPHNIFKFHQVGHQEFAWYLRTRPQIINIFASIWNTTSNNLVCSFDGSCYIKNNNKKLNTKCWTHTDQAPKNKGLTCYQGFISLTDNKDNSLVVYENSHLLHEPYFRSINKSDDSKNWQLINHDYLNEIQDKRRILNVPAGSLVLWDSRTFHQNIHSNVNEERIVQYISMLPKNNKLNSLAMQKKRKKYFDELRTTSHWAYPIRVNSLQPQTYGNNDLLIDYNELEKPNLENYIDVIKTLI